MYLKLVGPDFTLDTSCRFPWFHKYEIGHLDLDWCTWIQNTSYRLKITQSIQLLVSLLPFLQSFPYLSFDYNGSRKLSLMRMFYINLTLKSVDEFHNGSSAPKENLWNIFWVSKSGMISLGSASCLSSFWQVLLSFSFSEHN